MSNTAISFECEINDLGYSAIEWEIANYFDMGTPDSSGLPMIMRENESINDCILVCSDKSGTFSIRNIKLTNDRFLLCVRLIGKLN